jgi:REP element-mobilizing transposase RayT
MDDYESLSHTKWDCKIPRGVHSQVPQEGLLRELKQHLGEVFRKLALQKESRIEQGHLMPDHVHMMISIPPKYAVSQVIGFIKGQERNPFGQDVRGEEAQLCGTAFLGQRVLRLDRRSRRSGDTGVHQEPGARGQTPGPTQPVALIAAFRRLKSLGSRQRPHQPLLAAPNLKPPALPGDTYSANAR